MIEVLSARESWCYQDERILWCHPLHSSSAQARYIHYAVSGLDVRGDKRWTAPKVVGGVASGVVGVAIDMVGSGDEGGTEPTVPQVIVSGKSRDCLAVVPLIQWQASGANAKDGRDLLWMLTSHRLGLLEFADVAGSPASGAGLLGGLKKTFDSFAARGGDADSGASVQETELPGFKVHAEFPRNSVYSIDVVDQDFKSRKMIRLRITFTDGSSIDIADRKRGEREYAERMLAMSRDEK